jgi:hypothetical protein
MIANYKAGVASELIPLQTPLSIFRCPSDGVANLIPENINAQTSPPAAPGSACGKGIPTNTYPQWDRYFNGIQVSASNYMGSKGQIDGGCPLGNADRCADTGVFFGNSQVSSKQITDGTSSTFMIGERSKFCFAGTWVGVRNPVGPDAWSGNWAVGHVASPHGKLNYGCTNDHNTCTEGFSSTHPGGGFFAYCDGSVHFISDDIQFDGLVGKSVPGGIQIDSDSTGQPCYAGVTSAGPQCKPEINGASIGVYQRLAWRNDGLVIDGGGY